MSPSEQLLTAARIAADLLLALVPAPIAHQLLDDSAVRRANAIANAAEDVKFGPESGE